MIKFFVAGWPKSQKVAGVVRFQRAGVVHMVPKRGNADWATLIGYTGRAHAPTAPYPADVGVSFSLVFLMPRPRSLRKRVTLPLKRPDIENLMFKLSDLWNGIFWMDDSQIVDLIVSKRFAADGHPGVQITVQAVDV